MKDLRILKGQCDKRHEALQNLSDTDILLEFSNMLTSIYPHLIRTCNHSSIEFMSISERLYFNFVYGTLANKYGAIIERTETHTYGDSKHCYRNIHHIFITPKSFPLICKTNSGNSFVINKKDLKSKELIFLRFGDIENFPLLGDKFFNPEKVHFNDVFFVMVDKKTGYNFRNYENLWIAKNRVDFELILEDYNYSEHVSYRSDVFAD